MWSWFLEAILWRVRRERRLADAYKTSIRRDEEAQLKLLEAEGIDVSALRHELAALDADDAPKALPPASAPPAALPPAPPTPPVKRPPGRPRKSAAPGEPFRNGKPAR